MRIPYTQVNAYIVNSFKVMYTHILTVEPQISFLDYIKSQLHVNIVNELYSRSIRPYYNSYKYLTEGDNQQLQSVKQVIHWYYHDLSECIFKTIGYMENDFSILKNCSIPQDIVPVSSISLMKVKEDLNNILTNKSIEGDVQFNYFTYLNRIPLEYRSGLKATHILAEAISMAYLAELDNINILDINN